MLHQHIRLKALGVVLFSATLLGLSETAVAADTLPPGSQPVMNQTVTGLSQTVTLNPTGTGSASQPVLATAPIGTDPVITTVTVTGEVNPTAAGTAYYDTVKIALTGQHLTNDNFLTAEGLHWSDETKVEVMTGEERGILNDPAIFGAQNTPIQDVTAYSIAVGNKGRITHVGKTVSGLDLDLLWTITETDSQDWQANSGMGSDARVKGIGFAGEQTIPNTRGNSIVVLYNEANMVGIHYQIVKHGTLEEVPVILSFITTDIDGAQGVKTNLANLTQLVPSASDLAIDDDGVIYDASTGGPYGYGNSLNGSAHLPKGGYLGAGFVSHFDYTFYSPAPARQHDTYSYSPAVRYDIFGSSLQANVETTVKQLITVHYQDNKGVVIKSKDHYEGVASQPYLLTAPTLEGYTYKEHKVDTRQDNKPVVTFIYQKEHTLTINYVDEAGKVLKASERLKKLDGEVMTLSAPAISGYQLPQGIAQVITGDMSHTFVYKKPASTQARPVQTYRLTFTYVDDTGKTLAPSKIITKTAGDKHRENPVELAGYNRPESYQIQVTGDTSHVFVYSPLRTVSPSQPNPSRPSFFSPTTVVNQLGSPVLYQPQLSPNASWQIVPVLPQGGWTGAGFETVNLPVIKPSVTTPSAVEVIKATRPMPKVKSALGQASYRDYYYENTGSKGDDKVAEIAFVKTVGDMARIRHRGKKDIVQLVNRDIALAIASSSYGDDFLQSLFSDYSDVDQYTKPRLIKLKFWENAKKNLPLTDRLSLDKDIEVVELPFVEKAKKSFKNRHIDKSPVDLAHAFAAVGSVYRSRSGVNNIIKGMAKFGGGNNHSLLLQNSLFGDLHTIIDERDIRSDLDAIIFTTHPAYKNKYIDRYYEAYYSSKDLDKKRVQLYLESYRKTSHTDGREALKSLFTTASTLGGLGLMAIGLYKRKRQGITLNDNARLFNNFISRNKGSQPTKVIPKTSAVISPSPSKTATSKETRTIGQMISKPVTQVIKKTSQVIHKVQKIIGKQLPLPKSTPLSQLPRRSSVVTKSATLSKLPSVAKVVSHSYSPLRVPVSVPRYTVPSKPVAGIKPASKPKVKKRRK